MKKNKVKTTLSLIIIMVLCLSVGAYAAYVLSATEVSYTKSDGTTVSVKAALDELNTKRPTKSIGDEVTVGGEQFYVLGRDNNSDTVELIAKYNLNSDGTAQSSVKVNCEFSSTDYWSSSFTSSPFNLNDFIGFTSTDALGKAKSYGISKGAVSSRLLSYEEANALKTKVSSNSKIKSMYANGQYYWLGSANGTDCVWVVLDTGALEGYYSYRNSSDAGGVRPVITVLKSSIS